MHSSNNEQVSSKIPPSLNNVSTSLSIAKEPTVGNEDAWFIAPDFGLMAISDGVSNESTLTSFWSNTLVQNFCNSSQQNPCEFIRDRHTDWLQPLQAQWQQTYQKMLQRIQSNKASKVWNSSVAPQAQRNAKGAATFAGVHLFPTDNQGKGKWQAIAVGDSCVFQFRKVNGLYELQKAFPLEQSANFSSKTGGFTSRSDMSLVGDLKFIEEEYELGDTFFLATDALAEWLLKNREEGKDDWQKLLEIEDQAEFNRTIEGLRNRSEIVFDDTTFARMQVVTSPKERQAATNSIQFSAPQPRNLSNTTVGTGNSPEAAGLRVRLSTFTGTLLGWLGIKDPEQESADPTESAIAKLNASLHSQKALSLPELLPLVDTVQNIYTSAIAQKQTQGTLAQDDPIKTSLDNLLADIKKTSGSVQSSQQTAVNNVSSGVGTISLPPIQPYQNLQAPNPQLTQISLPQPQNNSGIPQTIVSSPSTFSTGTFGGNNVASTSAGSNTGTDLNVVTNGSPNTTGGTPTPTGKSKSQSTPFWKNKKFLQTAAIVGATVAAVGAIAYAIHEGHHDLPGAVDTKGWHDALSADFSADGTLSKSSWEQLTKASPQELQSLAKQDPVLAQRLEAAIANHLEVQSKAGELLDAEKLKALRESGGVALKDFAPSDEKATLKFINENFEKHGLEGSFKTFAEAQQYVSSQASQQYNNIDISLKQDIGTTYRQFDDAQKTLSSNGVYDQIKQQWETQRQGLQKAKDVLSNAMTSSGSSILEETRREGGSLNASADSIYLESQQGFNWAAVTSTGMTVGKMTAKSVLSHALPVVGAALTTYSVSKRTYDHLMTKADKLGILAEREGSSVKERLQHTPKDLARVVNQAVADAPQDFRDMCDRFHQTSKNILSAITSKFGKGEEERSQMEVLAITQKVASR